MTTVLECMDVEVVDDGGTAQEGALVLIARRDSVPCTPYTDPSGSTPAPNPARTGPRGLVSFWVPRGPYSYVVTTPNFTSHAIPWDAAPGSDGAIDMDWLSAEVVAFVGSTSAPFEYVVSVPSSSITVPHNLGRTPSRVTAYDNSGQEVVVGVQVIDLNTVDVTTVPGLPFSGKIEVL